MKKLLCLTMAAITLSGCAASVIGLRHPRTGDIEQCRRGWWGTNTTMEECAQSHIAKGYVRMSEAESEALPPPEEMPVKKPAAAPMQPAPVVPPVAPGAMAPMPQQYYGQPNPAMMVPQPQPMMQQPMAMPAVPAPAPARVVAPAPAQPEEKPYFSQYPTSETHKGGMVLPDFMK